MLLLLSCFSHVQLFVSLWTIAHQAFLSMGFPRQEYWSRLPFPSPGELPNPGIKLVSPALQMDSLPLSHLGGKKKWSEVAQLCPTLCDPMGCSLSGSSVHGIFQARVLEWIAISFSRGPSWPRNQTQVSRIAGRRFTVWATREAQKSNFFIFQNFLHHSRFSAFP